MDDFEKSLMQDQGLYAIALPLLLPLLKKKKENALAIMANRFRAGETNFVSDVAAFVAITDIEMQLTQNQQLIESIEEREYDRANNCSDRRSDRATTR